MGPGMVFAAYGLMGAGTVAAIAHDNIHQLASVVPGATNACAVIGHAGAAGTSDEAQKPPAVCWRGRRDRVVIGTLVMLSSFFGELVQRLAEMAKAPNP